MELSRSDRLVKWIEEDQNEYKKEDKEFTEDVFLSLCTADFKVTNLKDNILVGQGYEYVKMVSEYEKDLKFKVVQIMSAGDFEVVKYAVTNKNGNKGSGTILYRYRNDKVCEMLMLDHD